MAKTYAYLFGNGAKSCPYQFDHERPGGAKTRRSPNFNHGNGANTRPNPNFTEAHLWTSYIFSGARDPHASRGCGIAGQLFTMARDPYAQCIHFLLGRVAHAGSAAGRHQLFYLSPGHDVHVWSTTLTGPV